MAKRKYLNKDELQAFFAQIKKEKRKVLRARDQALFWLTYSCGLRAGEAAGLRMDDLHLDGTGNQFILVRRLKRKQIRNGVPLDKKKEPVLSKCNLSLEDLMALESWLKMRGKFRPATVNPYLFIGPKAREDDHLTTTSVYFRFQKYAKAAGLGGFSPHSLRHSCAVMMAQAGLNAFDIQEHLGHVSVSSTEHYVKLHGPEQVERGRKISKALRFRE